MSAFFSQHGGGIEAVAGNLATALAAQGVDVHWMAGGPAVEAPLVAPRSGLQITRAQSFDPLEARLGVPAPLWSPASVLDLWREVKRADIVHVHDYLYMPTLLAALFARWRRRPLVVTQHIGEIPFQSARARKLLAWLNRTLGAAVLRSAKQVVFVGRPVLDYFASITPLPAKPLLIPNGVDHLRYRPGADDARRTHGPVALLFVGRFVEKKGLKLLRACLDLPGTAWTFIGWGPLDPLAGSTSPTAGIVNVLGRLPAEAIVQHYRQAALLVLPSTGEGFPLVVQEALACGTPVLVSTEVAEAFPSRDPRCVFDVELRSADPERALKLALAALTADPQRLAAARPLAVELAAQWSWARCVADYRSIYDRLTRRS